MHCFSIGTRFHSDFGCAKQLSWQLLLCVDIYSKPWMINGVNIQSDYDSESQLQDL